MGCSLSRLLSTQPTTVCMKSAIPSSNYLQVLDKHTLKMNYDENQKFTCPNCSECNVPPAKTKIKYHYKTKKWAKIFFKKKVTLKTNTAHTGIASERQQPHVATSAEKASF